MRPLGRRSLGKNKRLRPNWNWERHWNGSIVLLLLLHRRCLGAAVAVSLNRSLGSTISVSLDGSLWGSVAIGLYGSLGAAVAVLNGGLGTTIRVLLRDNLGSLG